MHDRRYPLRKHAIAANDDHLWADPSCHGRRRAGGDRSSEVSRAAMLRALQNDVNAWPARVKESGVTNMGGAAYVPVPRNNEILRTPDDPEATYAYMIRVWGGHNAETGSAGWCRIIAQAGKRLTWEWLIADDTKAYAALFPDDMRERVRRALEDSAGYAAWRTRADDAAAAQREREESVQRIRGEIRAGTRARLSFPELDQRI